MGGVYGLMSTRRGNIVSEEQTPGTPMMALKAHLPVSESFGFTGELGKATGGKAFTQMSFSHWALFGGDPMVAGTKANTAILDTRKRKGLKVVLPDLHEYLDKL